MITYKENEYSSISLYQHKTTKKNIIKRFSKNTNDDVFRYLKSKQHKNLPMIYEVCAGDSSIIVLEEYIEGEKLSDILENSVLTPKIVCKYAIQICDALIFLHSAGIVHRDIKPSNIIIKEDKTAVLIDLSIARFVNGKENDTQALGTPGYAAPEQFGITQSNTATDIYSLGVLLNIMLTGSHPSVVLPKGPIKHIIKKCTKVQIFKRYSNVSVLRRAIVFASKLNIK